MGSKGSVSGAEFSLPTLSEVTDNILWYNLWKMPIYLAGSFRFGILQYRAVFDSHSKYVDSANVYVLLKFCEVCECVMSKEVKLEIFQLADVPAVCKNNKLWQFYPCYFYHSTLISAVP